MKAMVAKKTTIGQLAHNAGAGIETVRFYARRGLTQHKLEEIDANITDLEHIHSVLHKLSQSCSAKGSVNGCPNIEAIASTSDDNP
jgi:hypothetical protein